jgi:CubicO group peptidase (beta-lactamase class C family)
MAKLFVAVDLPPAVTAGLALLQPPRGAGVRLARRRQMHLTLHYLGKAGVGRVAGALAAVDVPAFPLAFEGLGRFPSGGGSVTLWAGVRVSAVLKHLDGRCAGVPARAVVLVGGGGARADGVTACQITGPRPLSWRVGGVEHRRGTLTNGELSEAADVNVKSYAPLVSCFLLLSAGRLAAGEMPTAKPEEVGLSAAGLEKVRAAVRQLIKEGKTAGAVVLVARHGKIVLFDAQGVRDVVTGKPMEKDTILRFYSMTKPVTTAAAMILFEKGLFRLDDPVSKYLPELKGVKVHAGGAGGELKLVAAGREMTIRDLMRHTSGLTYAGISKTPVAELYLKHKVLAPGDTLEQTVAKLGKLPLVQQPGSRFHYGVSTDVLGRLVEVVARKNLADFVREQILEPLDMRDTAYYVPEKKRERFGATHGRDPKGRLVVIDPPAKSPYLNKAAPPFGGHGLVSTARDYARFCQMLLGKGRLDGRRVLREETVALMTKNQLPKEAIPISVGPIRREGVGFGLGFSVCVAADEKNPGGRVGEYGWGGAASTHFWVSPKDDLFVVALQQHMPFDMALEVKLKPLVYAAVEDPKK